MAKVNYDLKKQEYPPTIDGYFDAFINSTMTHVDVQCLKDNVLQVTQKMVQSAKDAMINELNELKIHIDAGFTKTKPGLCFVNLKDGYSTLFYDFYDQKYWVENKASDKVYFIARKPSEAIYFANNIKEVEAGNE